MLAAEQPAPVSTDAGAELLELLADTRWVWSQYDHQLFLNTVEGPGGDAAVLRLKHPVTGVDTGRGLALTTDGNHRWCAVDPRAGTALTVAESVLNLACVGARPLAVVNCLNFGNPEHPEVMWQLSEAIDGMTEACRAFGIPVIGGNVSLYNESRGADIDPTPVVGMLGVVDQLDRRPPGVGLVDGGRLLLVGVTQPEVSGSRWARERGHRGGKLPVLDVDMHRKVADVVRTLVTGGLLAGVHDVGNGGLGVALAEMAVAVGPRRQRGPGGRRRRAVLREPVAGRAVRRPRPAHHGRERAAPRPGVPVSRIGVAGGDRVVGEGPARPAAGRGRRRLATTASPRPSAPARLRTDALTGESGTAAPGPVRWPR